MAKLIVERQTNNGWEFQEVVTDDSDFDIDPKNIDGELSRMGNLLCFYGDLYGDLVGQLARHKSKKDRITGEYALWYRDPANYDPTAKGKLTEKKIEALLVSVKQVQDAEDQLNETKRYHSKAENMYRSMRGKNDALIALSNNVRAEIKALQY